MEKNFEFGFVVSTLGRTAEITRMLESLERQTVRDLDVVVVDQNIIDPNERMLNNAHSHARGMGFVLRRHGYGFGSAIYWMGRPSSAAVIYALKGKTSRKLYYSNVAKDRLEGWLQRA